jgi:hypothetical protein
MRKCRRVLLDDFEPIWIRSPDTKYWVYSLMEPTHITLKCRPLGGSPLDEDETVEMLLTDTGVLPNTSTCYIYAETFKLLPHSSGRTLAGLNKTHIVLPNIESILKPDEQELLQTTLDTRIHLQEIDEAVRDIIKIKDRAALGAITALDELRRVDSTSTSTVYCVTGISISVLILMASLCYYYRHSIATNWRRCMPKRTLKPKPFPRIRQHSEYCNESSTTLDTALPLNVIVTNPNVENEGEAETAVGETGRAPTPFVSRGRLPHCWHVSQWAVILLGNTRIRPPYELIRNLVSVIP